MLVLKRKDGESVVVDGPARIKVIEVGCNWVKIGIEAPNGTRIIREELIEVETEQEAPCPACI